VEVNIHEAKTHLSRLIDRVEQGEEVTIMRSNVPVAKLVAVGPSGAKRELGWARGEFTVPDDFDAPLPPDLEDSFY
jgi:prevent-host-death family protein